jgi:hypothetical protein
MTLPAALEALGWAPLHANGDDSEPAYRKAILDWLIANGGRPRGLRRSITDPLGTPSLR